MQETVLSVESFCFFLINSDCPELMCIHTMVESLENSKSLYLSGCGCQIIKPVNLQNGVTCGSLVNFVVILEVFMCRKLNNCA